LYVLPVLQQDPLQHVYAKRLQETEERKREQDTYTALPSFLTEGPNFPVLPFSVMPFLDKPLSIDLF
jgi:hypothetical protein